MTQALPSPSLNGAILKEERQRRNPSVCACNHIGDLHGQLHNNVIDTHKSLLCDSKLCDSQYIHYVKRSQDYLFFLNQIASLP